MKKVDVSLEKATARVEFDHTKTTPEKLAAAIARLGFKARVLSVEPGG